MNYFRFLFLLLLQMTLSSCFMHASVTTLEPKALPDPPFSKVASLETVAGVSNYTLTTISGYKVKQSVGLLLNKQLASTPNGYKAYLHVIGRMTSEELKR